MSPVHSMARQPVFSPQWPGPGRIETPAVLIAAAVAGLVAAIAVPWDRPGVGWLITGLVAAGATVAAVTRARRTATTLPTSHLPASIPAAAAPTPAAPPPALPAAAWVRLLWTTLALALLAVGTMRAAGWLFVWCVLGALIAGTQAVGGGRSVLSMVVNAFGFPLAAARALPWSIGGVASAKDRSGRTVVRTAAAVAVGIALLVVFGALLAGADAAFEAVLSNVLPTVDGVTVFRWIVLFGLVAPGTLAACFLAAAPPNFDTESRRRFALRRIEWALPVGLVVALFAVFVAVQATVLFGGRDHVLRTANLTYAEYARSGFWQLLVVTALTLVVLAVAARVAARETAADRIWLRVLLGALAGLTLVIVASAMSRMWAYEQAYGFTRLRLLVSACELWLGVLFVLVLAAGVTLKAPWLPRAVVATGLLTLLGLAALNPDRFIAERNIARSAPLDIAYLSGLSADAAPALDRLPEPQRSCALRHIVEANQQRGADSWWQWNLGRWQADELLRRHPYVDPDPFVVGDGTCWRYENTP